MLNDIVCPSCKNTLKLTNQSLGFISTIQQRSSSELAGCMKAVTAASPLWRVPGCRVASYLPTHPKCTARPRVRFSRQTRQQLLIYLKPLVHSMQTYKFPGCGG